MKQIEIEISGRVQGVYYRTTISKIATNFDIKGFVENKSDGTVYILGQGSRDNLEEFIRWCQRGSMFSKVEGMSFKFTEVKKKYKKFSIKAKNGVVKDKIKGIQNLGKKVTGQLDMAVIPRHLVIIPDGNRRWAREKNWHPWTGHVQVTKNRDKYMTLFKEAQRLGIKYVTFWAFSTENWKRDEKEINVLFNLMRKFTDDLKESMGEYNIRLRHIGRKDRIPADIVHSIKELEEMTKDNDGLYVQFALDYGGRDELVRAFSKMKEDDVTNITEEVVQSYLDTGLDIPDPDLIIRTGGEKRTSGMMIWQSNYAELYFTNVLFPDFDIEDLRLAVLDYSYRTRRFGGTDKKDLKNIKLEKLHEPEEQELAALALA
jgi:undecaprenyl diphosphate synthase